MASIEHEISELVDQNGTPYSLGCSFYKVTYGSLNLCYVVGYNHGKIYYSYQPLGEKGGYPNQLLHPSNCIIKDSYDSRS